MPCELIASIATSRLIESALFIQCFMLKQQRLFFIDIDELPYDDPNAAAVLAALGLRRTSPATIQQDACRRHARGRWHGLLADDPGEHLDA